MNVWAKLWPNDATENAEAAVVMTGLITMKTILTIFK
jgi:hypothetical protein